MSSFLRSAQQSLSSSSPSKNLNYLIHFFKSHLDFGNRTFFLQSRPYSTDTTIKSPFESNIVRILDKEIEYHADFTTPHQPVTKFSSFLVEDQPGESWMTMRRKFNGSEDIKIEVTMFDGCMTVPRLGEDSSDEDVRLHISVLVDVYKGDEGDALEFACSAWPDCLEIQKVYFLRRGDTMSRPYTGPDFRALNGELQQRLREFLEERGVNDQFSGFLHEYMMKKDRIELVQWYGKLKAFVEN